MSSAVYTLLEPLVVALVVMASIVTIVRRHAPGLWARLAGKSAKAGCHHNTGCANGCGSCGSAGPAQESVVALHRPGSERKN